MSKRLIAILIALCLAPAACNRDPEAAKKKYIERGNKFFDSGKYKEALLMYKNALRRDMKYGEAYYRSALAELKLMRIAEAAKDLHRSIELQPGNYDAYSKLINIYLNAYLSTRNRPKQIIDELKTIEDRLAKRDPNNYELIRLRAYLALADKRPEDAVAGFKKALEMKPYTPDIVLVLIQTLNVVNRSEEAEKLGKDMIAKDKTSGPIYDALYIQYLKQKRLDDAEHILQQKLQNNPKIADNYLQLAAHYVTVKKREEMDATLKRLTGQMQQFPKAHQYVGDFYLRMRDFDRAIDEYQQGAKAVPAEKHSYEKRMIEAYVLNNRVDEGKRVLEQVLKEDPKDSEAIAIRAALQLAGGSKEQIQAAINDLQTVVSKMPENHVLRFNLGRAYLARGNAQQARIQFEEAIKLRPDYLLPRLSLAQMTVNNKEYGRALQMVQEMLAFDPMNIPARLLRTRALIGMGEIPQARIELAEISKQVPNSWEAKLQSAALEMAQKNYPIALTTFREIYDNTHDPRALIGLTETYVMQGQHDTAMKVLEAEMAKNPQRTDYLVALGNIAVRAKQFPRAIGYYQKAIEKNNRNADAWMRLGFTQRASGDVSGAVASYNKAKELAPTDIRSYIQLATLYAEQGQMDQAKPIYEQILKIDPNEPTALNNLAYMMAENGSDLDTAMTMAQRARQARPNEPNVADTLGWIYIKKNLADSAINIFRDLVQQNPTRSTYQFHLGVALMQKGDKPAARKAFEEALRLKPGKDEEAKIREMMAKVG